MVSSAEKSGWYFFRQAESWALVLLTGVSLAYGILDCLLHPSSEYACNELAFFGFVSIFVPLFIPVMFLIGPLLGVYFWRRNVKRNRNGVELRF
ncbi:MAG: hypothetical protein AMS22_15685 [Thiotrichales bacterium SG8_50]|nr:MAG: hypothetical protein AMS22_15685 [Thiotrichales bacterium SG8_50]